MCQFPYVRRLSVPAAGLRARVPRRFAFDDQADTVPDKGFAELRNRATAEAAGIFGTGFPPPPSR